MNNMKQTQDDKTIQPFNCSTIQRVKAYAFTLAETLIVIGIIGVVAALTLPNLNHATGDKEKVTKVKKIYASLTDAVDRAQAIYGDFDTWFNDLDCNEEEVRQECSERFAKRVTEFMKVSKDCGSGAGCFADVSGLDGLQELQSNGTYMVVLSDGTSLGFHVHTNGYWSGIRVDIDGPNKGKNKTANDLFCFDIVNNQLYPGGGFLVATTDSDKADYCLNFNYCTEWVVEIGNMEYLKADNGVCPNGGQLSWTSTDCSTAKQAAPANEEKEEEDDDMGFILFD